MLSTNLIYHQLLLIDIFSELRFNFTVVKFINRSELSINKIKGITTSKDKKKIDDTSQPYIGDKDSKSYRRTATLDY